MNQPKLDKVTLTMLEALAKKARPVVNSDKYLSDLIRKMYMSL
jgi:hypothetical protein